MQFSMQSLPFRSSLEGKRQHKRGGRKRGCSYQKKLRPLRPFFLLWGDWSIVNLPSYAFAIAGAISGNVELPETDVTALVGGGS
ncbi:MAG TPA: hypothetical protein VK137_03570 [Planctomycetaceae bacterium]|nr:hypothetical protein [Planctomycetaceae bacterium]